MVRRARRRRCTQRHGSARQPRRPLRELPLQQAQCRRHLLLPSGNDCTVGSCADPHAAATLTLGECQYRHDLPRRTRSTDGREERRAGKGILRSGRASVGTRIVLSPNACSQSGTSDVDRPRSRRWGDQSVRQPRPNGLRRTNGRRPTDVQLDSHRRRHSRDHPRPRESGDLRPGQYRIPVSGNQHRHDADGTSETWPTIWVSDAGLDARVRRTNHPHRG